MRMRNKKHAEKRIAALEDMLVKDLVDYLPPAPLHIEIGCGKGSFISETARRNPDISFLAIEKVVSVILSAMENASENAENVKFFLGDATDLGTIPMKNFCERIYLNFSDPWPKKKHTKRRLTSPLFLELYKKILTPDGEIHLKTDNQGLFEYSIETLTENGFGLKNVTWDLHSGDTPWNIPTEYEFLFSSRGVPICRLEAFLKP